MSEISPYHRFVPPDVPMPPDAAHDASRLLPLAAREALIKASNAPASVRDMVIDAAIADVRKRFPEFFRRQTL